MVPRVFGEGERRARGGEGSRERTAEGRGGGGRTARKQRARREEEDCDMQKDFKISREFLDYSDPGGHESLCVFGVLFLSLSLYFLS